MGRFVSEYLGLDDELDKMGVFDCVLDNDSRFFINLMRLKVSDVPEFKGAYQRINDYFSEIATLLNASDSKEDKLYKTALKRFKPLEINGINLGFSESKHGAAFGKKLRRQVISDAFDIVKKGILYPEIFQLVSLFEENIGPDRLSDMISTIIYPDIVAYTKRIQQELKLNKENYPNYMFREDGLIVNPYKGCEILFLPIDILHELPIAQCWDDIDRVVSENENIRREINEAIGQEWSRWYARDKKAYLKEYIFKDPERCSRVIEGYKKSEMVKRYNDIYRVQMPNITPHVCRHTYCSNMAKSGMNPKTLQYLMGHSDIGVTLNTYTHLGLEDAVDELKRVEELENARKE